MGRIQEIRGYFFPGFGLNCGDVNDHGDIYMVDLMILWYDIMDYLSPARSRSVAVSDG